MNSLMKHEKNIFEKKYIKNTTYNIQKKSYFLPVKSNLNSKVKDDSDNLLYTGFPLSSDDKKNKLLILDLLKISIFLLGRSILRQHLIRLNDLLIEEAQKCCLTWNSEITVDENFTHKKVLRNVLERELGRLGFLPELGKAIDFLFDGFQSAASAGLLFKDPGAGIAHGEFTHPIQWLMIGWQQEATGFLSQPAVDVYKEMAKNFDKQSYKAWWDTVFDKANKVKDCGNPDYLHQWMLTSKNSNRALLRKLCESRKMKREKIIQSGVYIGLFKAENTKKDYQYSTIDQNLLVPRNLGLSI
jgi:hypothetical protein